ncbi:MAG: glycosyltransferase family 4 protein [Crocinitomicaceae bacterium]|nr:glycosyltransferase family 4 protein [Crocinitomicaceae bacterium]
MGGLVHAKRVFNYFFPRTYVSLILKKKLTSLNLVSEQIINSYSKPDLILEFLSVGSEVGVKLKNYYKVPLVIVYDAPLHEQFIEMNGIVPFGVDRIDKREKEMVETADVIIAYAQCVKEHILDKFHPTGEIYLLPCITWKQNIALNANKPQLIGFIGSFLSWHKVDLLVDAFIEIADEFPTARLVLLGYGQEWNRINEKVLASTCLDRIEMPGFVSEEQLLRYKETMMIGVMPGSNWYGSPLKLFEYAQSSIAIIAPETPAVVDLFSKEEVLFIDRNNSRKSLVELLRRLLGNDTMRNVLIGNASKKMTGEYSQREQMKKFNQIIVNTLEGGIKR